MNSALTLIEKTERLELLTAPEAEAIMEELLSGHVATPDIVRLLLALNQRQITVGELGGFARIMKRHAAPVFAPGDVPPENMVDTCGTGGDDSGTFNISTAAAFLAAAAGVRVAKHGNRAVSSRSGSADVLEALGVRIDMPLEQCGRAIRECGIGFLFAPAAHAATRHAVPARKQIAKRTIFNLLGPLSNPAGAQSQVLGVYSPDLIELIAGTLVELGVGHALVVHGYGGLDEISPAGETLVAEVRDGTVKRFVLTPEDFALPRAPLETLQGGSPSENAALIRNIFAGESGPKRIVVVMNAAAALVATGVAGNFRDAAEAAALALSSGAALEKLERLRSFTNEDYSGFSG
jgi:anthranilate phosphoribosyltransferase